MTMMTPADIVVKTIRAAMNARYNAPNKNITRPMRALSPRSGRKRVLAIRSFYSNYCRTTATRVYRRQRLVPD